MSLWEHRPYPTRSAADLMTITWNTASNGDGGGVLVNNTLIGATPTVEFNRVAAR